MNRGSSVPDDATVVRGYLPIGTNLPLTDRERTILQLITEGMSNREIAEYLILSPTTVKWYIKQIFNKLGANRRTQAVKIASEIHLTEIAPQYDPRPNIPAPALKLIGREKETLEVINLLDDPAVRLVTILGPGGIGKTRLAVEIAQQRAKQMPGQVCFAILDSVGTLAGLIQAVASAIGFQFHGKTEIGQQLLFGLRKRRLLLVMDSLEHLPEAGQLINRMLVAAPQLKILATSRERLSLTIETIYSLRGLDYPMTTSYSQDYAAFMLFMNIARFSQPVFRPSDDDTVHICRICQIVEGMPLAIELAARWIDLLTPEQIAEEISQGINILRTSLQDVPERHRNLHAVFERSWRLLSDEEREVFKKLSVFCGGIDRTAAEQVAGATLFMLSTLVDKSLLMRVGVDRYKPHELVRQFALEKLQENAGEYKDTLQNLCQYYARLMERYERAIKTDVSMLSDCVLKTFIDFDNILLGWNQALESLRVPEIVNYAFNINLCFTARGLTAAGINMFEQVLQLFDAHADLVEPIERVSVATFLGWSLLNHGLYERARQVMESAAEYISAVDNPDEDVGLLQGLWGWALYLTGQPNAGRSHAQEGLQICQSANFHFGVLLCLLILAEIEHAEECFEGAYHYLHEAMVLSERYRDSFVIAHTFAHLGHVC